MTPGEMATHFAAALFKGLTFGSGTVLMACAGAAVVMDLISWARPPKSPLQHGASWGGESPKAVVADPRGN